MFRTACLLFFSLLAAASHAQFSLALPEVTHYTKQQFKGGARTREIAQDKEGRLYFANDEGVLRFDGVRWQLFPLPNKSLVRCLGFGPDGRLYAGGQDEFGVFEPQPNGLLHFKSLKPRLPAAYRSFSDVWKLAFHRDQVFFLTTDRIYQLGKNEVKTYANRQWRFLSVINNLLVAQGAENGLLQWTNNGFAPWAAGAGLPALATITSAAQMPDGRLLLATFRHGIFQLQGNALQPWASEAARQLQSSGIAALCSVNSEQIAVGTSLDGCFVLDNQGRLVQHFGREQGLQDAGVLAIFLDNQQNIWLGLHKGIDFIPYNNAISHLSAGKLKEGAGYSAAWHNQHLYLATSQGLFRSPMASPNAALQAAGPLEAIAGTAGDAWNLSTIGQRLFMGHNDGAFEVVGSGVRLIDGSKGYWNFQPANANADSLVAGTYQGLQWMATGNAQTVVGPEAVVQSARFVVQAFGRNWFSHPYKGIYSVVKRLGGFETRQYGRAEGVQGNNDNYLFWVRRQLLLCGPAGIFRYEPSGDRFVADSFYQKHLPNYPIRYLREDLEGNIWFVFDKKIGVLDLSGRQPRVIYFPELTNKFVAGFEHIFPLDTAQVLMGGEQGFYQIDYRRYRQLQYPLKVVLSAVTAIGQHDSLLWGGHGLPAAGAGSNTLHRSKLNALRFQFAAPVYGQLTNIEFSYYLKGFDENWSDYDAKPEKDYTNLPPGTYTFLVKARNNLGNESEPVAYTFAVLPPWYKTWWAYTLFGLLLIAGAAALWAYQRRKLHLQQQRHLQKQARMQYLHQLEMDKAEKELVELRNAKLEAELQAKNNELAATALHLVQKSDVLQKIKAQMGKLKEVAGPEENAADLKKILKTLNEENRIDEQWQHFAQHFDDVHRNFLSSLRRLHPQLTPNEQKLCAYLKMNLTTKEIAQLMNISPRGVEISRYRLRKKLEVPAGVHLYNFLEALVAE